MFECYEKNKFLNIDRKKFSIFIAELIGTSVLVYITCGCDKKYDEIAGGLAVGVVTHLFGQISKAHVNPVTTICALITGHLKTALAPIYFLAQILGAVLGFGLLMKTHPDLFLTEIEEFRFKGMTLPTLDVTHTQMFLIEFVITCILSLANCASWDSRSTPDSMPLRFGFLVTAMNYIAKPYTGCSMNPARSFGPAFWHNHWDYHWIYWTAPILAAIISSFLYKVILNTVEKS